MPSSLAEQALGHRLVQPDSTTCGSCVLVVARMLNDAAYADFIATGAHASDDAPRTVQERFRREALAMHRRTSRSRDSDGRWQVPWPQALGTQPFALAREMTNEAGRRGTRYDAEAVTPSRRSRAFSTVARLASRGHTVPLYVGNRWSPRHVVLALPSEEPPGDEVRIYDPANGLRYPVAADDFREGRLRVAGWTHPWVVVAPD